MRDMEGDMDKYIKDQFPVKDGMDAKERATINAQATAMKSLGSSIFQSNASVGIPLTAGTVMQAMELGKDRQNVQIVQVNGVAHEAVLVNGQHVITSGPLQKREPAGAAVAPGAAPTTSAAMAQQGVGRRIGADGIPLPPMARALPQPYGIQMPAPYVPKTVMTPFSPD
jgi:hypothetical protein